MSTNYREIRRLPERSGAHKASWREIGTISLTCNAYAELRRMDQELVGTSEYMGIAWFWNYDFRHTLRDASYSVRAAVHDALLLAGLDVVGNSPIHAEIVLRVYEEAKARELR